MEFFQRTPNACRGRRSSLFPIQLLALLLAVAGYGINVRAQGHTVLVEGNCDSPVPGTTLVAPGTCGDFDGDGRIGTAEDTDGADRIFGTINAALGSGAGAAAGTGINFNGTVNIVTSGRFSEAIGIQIPNIAMPPTPGNVTLQAAPGVEAQINAVFQGDPSGGNGTRLQSSGIFINMPAVNRIVLRNLTVKNFAVGIQAAGSTQLTIDNCRLENNVFHGILALDSSNLFITNSSVTATGYRTAGGLTCPGASCNPAPGNGISFGNSSSGSVFQTKLSGNFGAGLANGSTLGATAVRYYEIFAGQNNNGNIIGPATRVDTP